MSNTKEVEKKSTFTEEYETSKKDKTFQEETKKLIEESKTTLQVSHENEKKF